MRFNKMLERHIYSSPRDQAAGEGKLWFLFWTENQDALLWSSCPLVYPLVEGSKFSCWILCTVGRWRDNMRLQIFGGEIILVH